jgi:hypothetical protein
VGREVSELPLQPAPDVFRVLPDGDGLDEDEIKTRGGDPIDISGELDDAGASRATN